MRMKLARGRAEVRCGKRRAKGVACFTLIELLVVIAIITILAALLVPVLARAKAQAQRIQCVNNLHQTGIALRMYVDDNRVYPLAVFDGQWWFRSLAQYHRLQWTNRAFHCPTYQGVIREVPWPGPLGSYSYNFHGTGGVQLGLGGWPLDASETNWLPTREWQVKAPSEMFAVADARIFISGIYNLVTGTPSTDTGGDTLMPHVGWFNDYAGEPQPFRHYWRSGSCSLRHGCCFISCRFG